MRELTATLCWLGDEPARPGARYLIKHTTRSVPARLDAIEHRLDVTTLGNEPADELALNEIGRVRLRLGSPLVPDPYEQVRATGAFIVVDPGDERHGRRRDGRLAAAAEQALQAPSASPVCARSCSASQASMSGSKVDAANSANEPATRLSVA